MGPETTSALLLSVRVAALATLLNALLGIPLAYILARRRFRGRALIDLVTTLPLVLPPTVTGYYLIVLLGRRGWLGGPLYHATGWSVAFTWYAPLCEPLTHCDVEKSAEKQPSAPTTGSWVYPIVPGPVAVPSGLCHTATYRSPFDAL